MSSKVEPWISGEMVRKWRSLAERRRAHFIELYRTGRWRKYFGEQEFLKIVREIAADLEGWDAVAGSDFPDASSPSEFPELRKAS